MYNDQEGGWTQQAEPVESPGFSYGVGTEGEFHVDGTPMRLAAAVIVSLIILYLWNRGGFRWHVVG